MAGKNLSDTSIFKSVTGSDCIAGEFKGEKPVYFIPRCKLLFSGNTLPLVKDVDVTTAFANRLKVLIFNNSIDPKEQDKPLLEKLWEERDSFVTLALRAAQRLAERNYEFTLPEDSKKFLDAFKLRGGVLNAFLNECCILESKARVFNTDLYAAYVFFSERNGIKKLSNQKLYDMLSGVPNVYVRRVRIGTENRQGHIGIALKETDASGTLEQQL